MVKVEEVHDEDLLPRPADDPSAARADDDWATDSDNESVSSADSAASDPGAGRVARETLAERLYALRDMLPPRARRALSKGASAAVGAARTTASVGGRALWVLSTSALLLGLPLALAMAEEQEIEAQEQQAKMAQTANEVRFVLDGFGTRLTGLVLNTGRHDGGAGEGGTVGRWTANHVPWVSLLFALASVAEHSWS